MIEAASIILLPLWPALAAALALGLVFGVAGWRDQPPGFWGRLGLILAVFGLAGGVALAVLGRLPGREGLWLEIGLAVCFTYLAGCLAGSILRAAFRRGSDAAGETRSQA